MSDFVSALTTKDGLQLTVSAPNWAEWQGALERAAVPGGQADAQRVLEECLLVCVRTADGARLSRTQIQQLSAQEGDALLAAALELMEEQRRTLGLQAEERPGALRLTGSGVALDLRPWTFGERNQALRQALRVTGAQLSVDLGRYERAMVLTCALTPAGERLTPAAIAAWPVPLGEGVVQALDRLNGLERQHAETLALAVQTGQDHPDLALLQLCRAFGWTPDQVERMDARTVERLLAALKLLQGPAVRPAGAPAPAQPARDEGVTRILVADD